MPIICIKKVDSGQVSICADLSAHQDEGSSLIMQTTMFLQIWTPSRAETFAYAHMSFYLHPDARTRSAQMDASDGRTDHFSASYIAK